MIAAAKSLVPTLQNLHMSTKDWLKALGIKIKELLIQKGRAIN